MKGRKIRDNEKVLHRCLFYSAPVIMRICFIGLFAWECLIDRIAGGSEFFLSFSFFFFFQQTWHSIPQCTTGAQTLCMWECVWLYLVSKTCIMSREVRKTWRIWSRAGLCCVLLINTFRLIAHMKAQCFQMNKTLLGHSCSWVSLKPKIKCGKKAAPRHHFLVPPNVI